MQFISVWELVEFGYGKCFMVSSFIEITYTYSEQYFICC